MPTCTAYKCNNRPPNQKLYRFPTNEQRRKIWTDNVGRNNWVPRITSYLCEVHFEESQFENRRLDGKRKLKPNAVPTVFPGLPQPRPHPAPTILPGLPQPGPHLPGNLTDGRDASSSQMAIAVASDHAYFKPKDTEKDDDLSDSRCSTPTPYAEPQIGTPMVSATNEVHIAAPQLHVLVSPSISTPHKFLDHNECKRKINFYRNEAKVAKRKLRETRERLTALEERLEGLFNRDQMQALQGKNAKKGVGNWTDSTVDRAFEIHNTIGKKAYNFLRDIGFPLPSMKTLLRRPRNDVFCIEEDVNDPVMPDHHQFNDNGPNILQILG